MQSVPALKWITALVVVSTACSGSTPSEVAGSSATPSARPAVATDFAASALRALEATPYEVLDSDAVTAFMESL